MYGYSVITHQAKAELASFHSLLVSLPGNGDVEESVSVSHASCLGEVGGGTAGCC